MGAADLSFDDLIPITPSKWNNGETRTPGQILQDQLAQQGSSPDPELLAEMKRRGVATSAAPANYSNEGRQAPVAPKDISFDDLIPAKSATMQDRAQAAASGVNKGVMVNTLGLPVDTLLNAFDLTKAAGGYVGSKLGMSADQLPTLTDRSKVFGSADYIANKFRAAGAGPVIDPNQPDDTASRVLSALGQGVGGSMIGNPKSVATAGQYALTGGASQALAQGTAEAGGDPSMQALASLVPGAGPAIRERLTSQPLRQPTQRDDAVARAQDAGYVFPPSQVDLSGSGLISGALEKLGGKAATHQAASVKNQNLTQTLVKNDLGIPADTPLNIDALNKVRSDAGAAYQAVKNAGPVVADASLAPEMSRVLADYDARVAQFPKSARNPAIDNLREDLQIPAGTSIDPNVVIDQVKQLRADGNDNRGSRDPATKALGKVQLGSADALENLIDRNLATSGQQSLLSAYRAARKTIAKTYTAQGAMDPTTGNIDANKLAKVLQRGKPISGGMQAAAEAASVAPSSTKDIKTGAAGISKLDAMTGMGSVLAAITTGHPMLALGALAPLASTGARAAILSGPYQRTMTRPNYGPGLLSNLASTLMPPDQGGLLGALAAGR